MGSRGDAYDNAVAETFFATLKKELVNRRSWPSRLELQSAVFEYIEAFYNRRRRHSTLGMVSPAEYEQTQKQSHPSRSNKQRPKQPGVDESGGGPLTSTNESVASSVSGSASRAGVSDPAGRSSGGGGLTQVRLSSGGLTCMGCVAHRRPRIAGVT